MHTDSKPPYSFSCLIFMAIEDSPIKALPVKDIYGWIVDHFPYYKNAPTGWKNSVRHNLSLNKCFRKVEKAPVSIVNIPLTLYFIFDNIFSMFRRHVSQLPSSNSGAKIIIGVIIWYELRITTPFISKLVVPQVKQSFPPPPPTVLPHYSSPNKSLKPCLREALENKRMDKSLAPNYYCAYNDKKLKNSSSTDWLWSRFHQTNHFTWFYWYDSRQLFSLLSAQNLSCILYLL